MKNVTGSIAIASSGDWEKDQRDLERFAQSDELIQRGMCPNGCGGMREVDSHNAECLRCRFSYFSAGGLNFQTGRAQ